MLIRSKWSTACATVVSVAALLLAREAVLATEQSVEKAAIVQINRDYDKRTVVKQSTIPNAGSGLFAAVKIKKGEIIGELGGRLVRDDHEDNGYLAELPRCAWKRVRPYKMIDSAAHAGHVSRINFAPSEINGRKTNFQNAAIEEKCKPPFVVFMALRDIEPDEEIWASYGPHYDYDKFMKTPEVRDFFCGLKRMDCRKRFTFAH